MICLNSCNSVHIDRVGIPVRVSVAALGWEVVGSIPEQLQVPKLP